MTADAIDSSGAGRQATDPAARLNARFQGQIGPMPARNAEPTTRAALAHAAIKYRIMGPSFHSDLTVPGPG
jgi:hypothetical protein